MVIAKNYLQADELEKLNRLVSMFFEFAEFRAQNKQHLKLDDWRQYADNFMAFNEQPLLDNAGRISRKRMEQIAHDRYSTFDQHRRSAEAEDADRLELKELENSEARIQHNARKRS